VIEDKSGEYWLMEGCLSLPNHLYHAKVTRANEILVRMQDENGEEIRMVFEGLVAYAIQHEVDHLNGKLYFDHLSSMKRRIVMDKFKKHLVQLKGGKMLLDKRYKIDDGQNIQVERGVAGD
jgi:peptide deformylase